ncbi:Choline kinase alpha-like protein [Dinothrombium tinctorium]|uniref:Choline kinase alpha-like protein n=1 Tax=Dinothrombium tinctorium TaxID=1965070 RepID=A0A3S3P871_9ACAR|nr:Choline kinase alpha-like protein [Dinothrombium tinctorium]RWS01556.1 Choline kinase alpha-like protein [Dinothrombium tinctorium]RWS03152.1 Choline kinase alpha-like protein [Dinothrombium tinctorium]
MAHGVKSVSTKSGGFVNRTYFCSIKNCTIPAKFDNFEPKEVVIHLNGGGILDGIESCGYRTVGEVPLAAINQILAQNGFAPKIYGIFKGGRIEEFIPSRITSVDDFKSVELCMAFARKLAKLHSLQLPIPKVPELLDAIPYATPAIDKDFSRYSAQDQTFIQDIINFPADQELHWFSDADNEIDLDAFLEEYLAEFKRLNKQFDPKYDNLSHLKMEVEVFDLLVCIAIIVFQRGALYSPQPNVSLDYSSGLARTYENRKLQVLNKYRDALNFKH